MNLKNQIEDELLENLNPVQREAVLHTEGPMLILAGAGSGKTRVITHRIAHLCRVREIAPWNLAAVTFTNKAAREMQIRLEDLIGPLASDVFIRTFHGLGLYVLRRNYEQLGLKSSFTIYDASDQKIVLKQILKDLKLRSDYFKEDTAANAINHARDALQSPADCQNAPNNIGAVYTEYIKRLRENNAVDFGDLLYETVQLFRNNPDTLAYYRRRWKYFLIDEYQDTNHVQYTLGRLIAEEHTNIAVVGDDDQSIYSWRGANVDNILTFEKDYSNCRILYLEENYRSTESILKLANRIIAHNPGRRDKVLFTSRKGGEAVRYKMHDGDRAEAWSVINRVITLRSQGRALKEMAVFYRTNAQSRIFEQLLREGGLPYILVGGFRFYERREIKDIVSYLNVVVNPDDDLCLERIINVPARKVGKTGLEKLQTLAQEQGTGLLAALPRASELARFQGAEKVIKLHDSFQKWNSMYHDGESPAKIVTAVLDESGYRPALKQEIKEKGDRSPEAYSRLQNLDEFLADIKEFEEKSQLLREPDTFDDFAALPAEERPKPKKPAGPDLREYLQRISLYTSESNPDAEQSDDSLHLITLHNAKGLEFPIVFLTGLEEGLLPHALSIEEGNEEEERRLLYVGITRAKEVLHLSGCSSRLFQGSFQRRLPSRFLKELGLDSRTPHSYAHSETAGNFPQAGAATKTAERSIYTPDTPIQLKTGDRVFHAKYAAGTVVGVEDTVADQKVRIQFDNEDRSRNFLTAYTPLRKLN